MTNYCKLQKIDISKLIFKMLYTTQILALMKNDYCLKPYFIGVYPSDMLPRVKSLPMGFIVNVDGSSEPGSHWLSIFISRSGLGYFFDSFGRRPNVYKMYNYMNDNCSEWHYNTKQYQNVLSTACGYYAMFVQILLCHGIDMRKIENYFTNSTHENDLFVTDFIVKYFELL